MTAHDRVTSRVLGTLHSLGDGKGKVRMESVYDTKPEDLWAALTEPDRLARWIAEVQGELRVGGAISARFTSGWEGTGRVEVCDPPRHLLVAMEPGTPDATIIEATLSTEGCGTRLVIEESGIPLTEIRAHGAGWQAHVEDLAAHLTGREPADWHTRWLALAPTYEGVALGQD